MESWYKITMSSADTVARKHMVLQDHFEKLLMTSGAMDAFMLVSDGRDSDTYYFSPSAMRIARQLLLSYGAAACPQPNLRTLQIVVGDVGVLDRLRAGQANS